MSEQKKQAEKVAIVTGGSRGIGRNTVVSLAKRHIDSIFTFNTHSEDAKAVIAEAKAAGARAIALQLDAGNIASFDGFVANVGNALSQLGKSRFDFLVNTPVTITTTCRSIRRRRKSWTASTTYTSRVFSSSRRSFYP